MRSHGARTVLATIFSTLIATFGVVLAAEPAQAAPPSNDDLASAQVLAGPAIVTASNVEATAEVGEPAHYSGVDAGASIWYQWTSPDTVAQPMMQLWTRGSDIDTVLAVYTGGPGVGDLVQVASNDDQGALTSRVQFQPLRDTTYYVAVDGCCGGGSNARGSIRLRLSEAVTEGSIEGFVTDAGGNGVDGFCAEALDGTGEPISHPGFTDASGWYVINGVPIGTDRHVRFRSCGSSTFAGEFNGDSQTLAGAGDILVQEGETTSGVNAVVGQGGSISGTISPDDGTSLVDGVCVRATMVGNPDDGFTRSTTTDSNGDYTIAGLDGGDYQVRFGGDCGPTSTFLVEYYNDATDPVDADLVTVIEASTIATIDASLGAAPGAISGTAREWEIGPGIEDICVRAVGPSYTSPSVDTDVNGDYTIPNVPAGDDHVVRFSDCHATSDPYTTQWYNRALVLDDADPIDVNAGQTTPDIDASMFRAATLGGQVTDTNGNARAQACVNVHVADGQTVASGQTDADGVWSAQVPPGTYEVEVFFCGSGLTFETRWYLDAEIQNDATEVFVDQGDVRTDLDQVTPGTSGTDGRMVGLVTDDTVAQNPLEGVCVTATRAGIGTDTVTDANGRYEFDALLPDDYTVEFYPCEGTVEPNLLPQYWNDVRGISLASPVTVSAGTTTSGIIARMHPGGSISGVVTNAADLGIANVCVTASNLDATVILSDSTDALGGYEIVGLPTDSYEVSFEDCTYEYVSEWYDGQPFPDGDPTPVEVIAGQVTPGIDATLERNGTISGTVTNEAGAPVADVCVMVYTADDEFAWFSGTDDTGYYLVGNLVTGNYKVWFSDCSGSYGDEFYDNKLDPDTADLVDVTFGEDTGDIDAVLQDTAPVNTMLPEIDGQVAVGETLTATEGTWDHDPSVFGYEWSRCDSTGDNCVPINAATDPTYLLTDDDFGHRIIVTVTASNSIGGTQANSELTDVVDRQPPPNDDIANRRVLSGALPLAVNGRNTQATRQPGEPDHLGYTQGASVWYEWTAPSGGAAVPAVVMTLAGSSYSTTLSVYDGTPTPFSGLDLVAQNEFYNGTFTSVVGFVPDPGTTYYIAVDGYFDGTTVSTGAIHLEISATSGVSGRVTDAGGNPIKGICARAYDAGFGSIGEAYTDANGDYFIPGLPRGDYRIDFEDCALVYVEEWYDDQPDFDSANLVHVANGAVTTDIDAELARYGTISGRVTDEQGDPVYDPSCGVYAYDTTSGFVNSARIDADGYYTIGFLQTGTYVVEFNTCTAVDYGIEWYDNKLTQGTGTEISVTYGLDTGGIDAVLQDTAPVNTAVPGITGSPGVGATLTASTGTWDHDPSTFAYQWQRCDSAGDNCTSIVGADDSTYVASVADHTYRIRVEVTATNSIGSTPASSAATAVVVAVPQIITYPAVTGAPDIGSTLTGTSGSWTESPTSFSRQWLRCNASGSGCVPISGAQGSTYVTSGDDSGARLRVRVTATNAAGSATATSDPTAISGLPRRLTYPEITGQPSLSSTLTASTGTWTESPTGFAYQWLRCNSSGLSCSPIAGAQSATFVTSGDDAGLRLRVLVTATNSAGSTTAQSGETPVIGMPRLVTYPVVSGQASIGSTLTTSDGTWSGPPTSFTYEWLRCNSSGGSCSPIAGAQSSTYVSTNDDIGIRLRSRVTAINTVGSASAQSDHTPIIGLPTMLTYPAVTGPASAGGTLSTTDGTWTGSPAFTYQWLRCNSSGGSCNPIAGAQASTYITTNDDIGARMRSRVTATNAAGSASATSDMTPVIGLPTLLTYPVVTGSPGLGSTLSTTNGSWTGSPTFYGYQWVRCDNGGNNCNPISGAQSNTYVTVSADIGTRLRARVTATNAAGSATAPSDATPVISVPMVATLPVVTGAPDIGSTLSASQGNWSGSPTSHAYQWLRCDSAGGGCAPIGGAQAATYVTTNADSGSRLRVRVTASNIGGSGSATSEPTPLIGLPKLVTHPVVTGTPGIGDTLSATDGSWTGTPTTFGYEWLRCNASGGACSPIPGAAGSTYVTTEDDAGLRLRARVTATTSVGSATAPSDPTPVIGLPQLLSYPGVTGAHQVGATLTVSDGTWSGPQSTFAYQWLRCDAAGSNCAEISGEQANTYVVTASDVGIRLRVRVTATNSVGTAIVQSGRTAVIRT